ncbi:hypothetical protein [Micromonospora sp. NBRC 101691]|uniref:hypothetical protein n=1 Tax=Micromonospora sp. NBRC 101691 TaxID=3032198 RepID=UPI00249FD10B|nr:hypothetical protein [Micromonospora sp. NBRC 101691]GLY21838.1 hypothetical protein Misp04_15700 [Micromonospora sp. NBRC 101691]
MTAPFRSLAQIRNRLVLAARWILRDHRPTSDGRCPVCRVPDCEAVAAARDYLDAVAEADDGAHSG